MKSPSDTESEQWRTDKCAPPDNIDRALAETESTQARADKMRAPHKLWTARNSLRGYGNRSRRTRARRSWPRWYNRGTRVRRLG